MIVYHGSDKNFKKLRISKKLRRCESTKTNEGLGIYFSTEREVAESYGRYIYTLEINDANFIDFRKRSNCHKYIYTIIKEIKNRFNIDITLYISDLLKILEDNIVYGGQCIFRTGHEIYMCLDSNYKWYESDISNTKRQQIYRFLNSYDKNNLSAYMFNYHIKNIGVIKSTDESIVKIVKKEARW